jgi:ABC-type enterochelin transport system permease subunit
LKNVNPSIVGAVTVIAMDTMKNAFKVATGKMEKRELANQLIYEMFVSTCSLVMGEIAQSFIEIPVLGFMIGSFVGSVVGSFAYNVGYTAVISFCVDTGFTMFGLVDQNYELPDEVLEAVGIEVFKYEEFQFEEFTHEEFAFEEFSVEEFETETIDIGVLRRGVIGVRQIGYV